MTVLWALWLAAIVVAVPTLVCFVSGGPLRWAYRGAATTAVLLMALALGQGEWRWGGFMGLVAAAILARLFFFHRDVA